MAALPKGVVTAGQRRGPSEISAARCHRLGDKRVPLGSCAPPCTVIREV